MRFPFGKTEVQKIETMIGSLVKRAERGGGRRAGRI
jgi:hypothetical protein